VSGDFAQINMLVYLRPLLPCLCVSLCLVVTVNFFVFFFFLELCVFILSHIFEFAGTFHMSTYYCVSHVRVFESRSFVFELCVFILSDIFEFTGTFTVFIYYCVYLLLCLFFIVFIYYYVWHVPCLVVPVVCDRTHGRGGGLGSSTIFKKFNEPYAPS